MVTISKRELNAYAEIDKLKRENEILLKCVKNFANHDACGEYGYGDAVECLRKIEVLNKTN